MPEYLPALYLFCLSLAQRAMMGGLLAPGALPRAAAAALAGALADALPALLLASAYGAGRRRWALAALKIYAAALAALLPLEAAYFLAARNRVDSVLLRNIEPLSVRAHLFSEYGLYALLAAAACAASAWAALRLASHIAPAGRRGRLAAYGLAAALALAWLAPALPEDSSHEGFVNFSRNRGLALIKAPSLRSLAAAFGGPRAAVIAGARAEYTPEEAAALRSLGLREEGEAVPAGPRLPLRRIVIIAAESLSRFYVGRWNPRIPAGITPFLDSLAAGYPSVENYWGGGMPTEEAVYSMLLSRPLYDVDSVAGRRLTPLFSVMRRAGWRSFILRGHTHFYQDAVSLYPRLYSPDRFIAAEELAGGGAPVDFNWGFHDREVLNGTLDLLERERARPVIALVTLMDTHPPYYSALPEEELPAAANTPLLRSLRSTDKALEEFFGGLRRRGLFDEGTLVIVTADHRPAYGESGSFMDTDNYMSWRIPLIFAAGSGAEALRAGPEVAGSHVDLAPTILGLLGLPAPEGYWGRSLFEPGRRGLALGSSEDFLLAQSPRDYFWLPYAEAAAAPPPGESAARRAFRKWVRNRLLGTTGRVRNQHFDERQGRWVRHAL